MKNRLNVPKIASAILFAAFVFAGTQQARAQISIVVAKSSTHTAEGSELKQIFSGTKLRWSDGERVAVVQLAENAVAKAFFENFVGISVIQARNEWSRLILTGQAVAPRQCNTDEAVKKAVAENADAVGFISSSSLDSSVKEIYRVITFAQSK